MIPDSRAGWGRVGWWFRDACLWPLVTERVESYRITHVESPLPRQPSPRVWKALRMNGSCSITDLSTGLTHRHCCCQPKQPESVCFSLGEALPETRGPAFLLPAPPISTEIDLKLRTLFLSVKAFRMFLFGELTWSLCAVLGALSDLVFWSPQRS